jgi:hypothetical protein
VASNRLLDRLISGRIWIGVIAFALIGIVTMQLGLLKLNAGIGRSLAREALLQRENATLSSENSEMAAGERIEAQAGQAGMELIPSGALRFLAARPRADVSKAVAALSASVPTAGGEEATSTSGRTPTTEGSSGTEIATPSPASAETSPSVESGSAATSAAAGSTTSTSSGSAVETGGETTSASAPTGESASTTTSAGGSGEAQSPSTSIATGGGTTGG